MIKVFEAFSGIGSTHKALKNLSIIHENKISDWYTDALAGYVQLHNTDHPEYISNKRLFLNKRNIKFFEDAKKLIENNILSSNSKTPSNVRVKRNVYWFNIWFAFKFLGNKDIKSVSGIDVNGYDILTYSFPCQDISIQGKQKGITKDTSSGLLYEIKRIIKETEIKPKILLLENVKALKSVKFKQKMNNWKRFLSKNGYINSDLIVISPISFGEVQHRQRVFMLSIQKNAVDNAQEIINEFQKLEYKPGINIKQNQTILNIINFAKKGKQITKNNIYKLLYKQDNKLKQGEIKENKINLVGESVTTNASVFKNKIKHSKISSFISERNIYNQNSLAPTITSSGANSRIKVLLGDIETFDNKVSKVKTGTQIVELGGVMHMLLMGFTIDDYIGLKSIGLSDTKIKFLAGNSIHIKVLEKIFKIVMKIL